MDQASGIRWALLVGPLSVISAFYLRIVILSWLVPGSIRLDPLDPELLYGAVIFGLYAALVALVGMLMIGLPVYLLLRRIGALRLPVVLVIAAMPPCAWLLVEPNRTGLGLALSWAGFSVWVSLVGWFFAVYLPSRSRPA